MEKPKKWKVLQRETAFQNAYWNLQDETVLLPDGSTTHFFLVEGHDGVLIVPLTAKREVILVRQYKHGVQKIVLEVPAGGIDKKDRSAKHAALRELREETGYVPKKIRLIGKGSFFPTSSRTTAYVFLAEGCTKVGEPLNTPTEIIEPVLVPLATFRRMMKKMQPTGMHNLAAAYLALDAIDAL